jgi:hypothetical protein
VRCIQFPCKIGCDKASPATTFRACSSPAPTSVKPQPAPAILSQESVHTTLSITHHTRKRPSTGPRTTHGPQVKCQFCPYLLPFTHDRRRAPPCRIVSSMPFYPGYPRTCRSCSLAPCHGRVVAAPAPHTTAPLPPPVVTLVLTGRAAASRPQHYSSHLRCRPHVMALSRSRREGREARR